MIKRGLPFAVVCVGLLVAGSPLFALDVPPLTGRVVDLAHVLPPDVIKSLASDLAAHEARTGNQVAVLILPSLQGENLEAFSLRVGIPGG